MTRSASARTDSPSGDASANARPGLPSAAKAISRAAMAVISCRAISSAATSSTSRRPKRSCGQRERTVGSRPSGRAVIRMNCEDRVGSSSVLRSTFWTTGCSSSASSKMNTRRRPSKGRYAACRDLLANGVDLLLARNGRPGNRHDVGMRAAGDAPARRARAARVALAGRGRQAVQALRDGQRDEALADAVRAGEDQALGQRAAAHRAREQRLLGAVALDVAERHGANCGSLRLAVGAIGGGRVLLRSEDAAPEPALLLRLVVLLGAGLGARPAPRRWPSRRARGTSRSGSGEALSATGAGPDPPPNSPPRRVSKPVPVCIGHSS